MTDQDYIKTGARARARELLFEIHKEAQRMEEVGHLPTANDILNLKQSVDELLHAIYTYNKP